MRMKVTNYSNEALLQLANAQVANQPQSFPHIYYDTQTYTSAATLNLTFFRAVQADPTLGNIEAPGSMPTPKFFGLESIGVDILLRPAAQAGHAATGPIDDVAQLVLQGRGTLEFNYQNKIYGPWPLSAFQASGGPTGFGWATMTAEAQISYANNGVPNGIGYGMNQQIIFKPNANFFFTLRWPAALTLAAGNTLIRIWLYGALYQAVV